MLSRVRKNLVLLCFPVSFLRKLYFFNNLRVSSSELPIYVLRYVISKSFFFPPEIEPVAFRELGRFDCSVQCRVLGQWGWNPFNGYHVTACLCFWCLILSSKNAFKYENSQTDFKTVWFQPASNRWPSARKADVITTTPWNLMFMIARPCFLCIFPDFFRV